MEDIIRYVLPNLPLNVVILVLVVVVALQIRHLTCKIDDLKVDFKEHLRNHRRGEA